MGVYQVTAPDGRKLRLTGDAPPTDADLDHIFASLPAPEPRRSSLFTDPRLDPAASEDLTDDEVNTGEMAKVAGLAQVGLQTYGGPLLKALGNPYVAGAVDAGQKAIQGGDPVDVAGAAARGYGSAKLLGAVPGLFARLRAVAQMAKAAPVVAEAAPAVAEVAPAAERAYQGIPSMMKVVAPETAPVATESVEGAKSILKALAPKAAPAAEKVAEAAAPVAKEATKKAVAGISSEMEATIEAKVIKLKTGVGKGLSEEQLADSMREIYKVPDRAARQIVKRVFAAQGYR